MPVIRTILCLLLFHFSEIVYSNSQKTELEVDKIFKLSMEQLDSNYPRDAIAILLQLTKESEAARVRLELGRAYLSSGEVSQGIGTFEEVLRSHELPPIVAINVRKILSHAKKTLFRPYFSLNVGVDSNPKNLPVKQDVILFGGVPLSYDPGEGSGQQSYVIYTVGVKGSVSRLINYNAYVVQTDYEKGVELDGVNYGLRLSSLWGTDTMHVRTSMEAIREDKNRDGYRGVISLDVTPDVFAEAPVTYSGRHTVYQDDELASADYGLSLISLSQSYRLDKGMAIKPSVALELFEPSSGVNAYTNIKPALEVSAQMLGWPIRASLNLGLKEYRKKGFMFGEFRRDVMQGLSVTTSLPIKGYLNKPLNLTVGYEHSSSSISFYDYSKVTVKLGLVN